MSLTVPIQAIWDAGEEMPIYRCHCLLPTDVAQHQPQFLIGGCASVKISCLTGSSSRFLFFVLGCSIPLWMFATQQLSMLATKATETQARSFFPFFCLLFYSSVDVCNSTSLNVGNQSNWDAGQKTPIYRCHCCKATCPRQSALTSTLLSMHCNIEMKEQAEQGGQREEEGNCELCIQYCCNSFRMPLQKSIVFFFLVWAFVWVFWAKNNKNKNIKHNKKNNSEKQCQEQEEQKQPEKQSSNNNKKQDPNKNQSATQYTRETNTQKNKKNSNQEQQKQQELCHHCPSRCYFVYAMSLSGGDMGWSGKGSDMSV